jgi:hypothetical protein
MILRVFCFACLVLLLGCASKKEVIVITSEGRSASAAEVDGDAFGLLPSGAVVWLRADAKELFLAEFGEEVSRFMIASLPFAKGAGIDPKQDVDLVIGAMYATVGSDVVWICRGRFKKEATASAIAKNPESAMGRPIQSTRFAGATMYVADQVAMSILTDRTLVFGTQLGVRRVLERVEEGRLKREVPSWFEALLSEKAASFQLGIDLDAQPIPATLGEKLPFMKGLRAARLLGNFREPGMNLAGTLTYKAPIEATEAAKVLNNLDEDLERYELFLRALGIKKPIEKLTARATDKDTQVTAEIDGRAIAKVLESGALVAEGMEAADWLPN